MGTNDRPIGVTVLSFMAFAASPTLVVLMGGFFFTILTEDVLPSVRPDPVEFVMFWTFLALTAAAFLAIAWISFRAGLDLWKMANRGRRLASVSMVLLLLLGIVYFLIGEFWSTVAGSSICAVSVFFSVYLQLPSIRRRFEAASQESS